MSAPSKPSRAAKPAASSYAWKLTGAGLVVCAGLSAGSYLVGLRPALGRLADQQAAERDLRDRLGQADRATADLMAARRRLDGARGELAALPLRLEPASAVNRRLNELARAAVAAGVTLDEVQPQPAVDGPHYQTVPIRVTGTGSYPAYAALLHALRTRFPDMTVRAFEAQNNGVARSGNVADFRLDLAWYTTAAPAAGPARK